MKKSLNIYALAKLQALLFLLLGLACGIIYSFGGLIIDLLVSLQLASSEHWSTPGLSIGTLLAFGALIGMPLIFGAAGYLLGLIEGLLFNLFAKKIADKIDLY